MNWAMCGLGRFRLREHAKLCRYFFLRRAGGIVLGGGDRHLLTRLHLLAWHASQCERYPSRPGDTDRRGFRSNVVGNVCSSASVGRRCTETPIRHFCCESVVVISGTGRCLFFADWWIGYCWCFFGARCL